MKFGLERLIPHFDTWVIKPGDIFQWIKVWKSLPVLSWLRAARYFRTEDFRSAAYHYELGLRRHSNHGAAHCARLDFAYCLYSLGDYERAESELQLIVSDVAPLKDSYLLLARIQTASGDTDKAAKTMSQCLTLFGAEDDVVIAFAFTVFGSESSFELIAQAHTQLEALKSKLSLDCNNIPLIETALALYESRYGDPELGEQRLSRALATLNGPYEAVVLRGEGLLRAGRIQQARAQLRRALLSGARDPKPAGLLAKTYLQEGIFCEPERAIELATIACKNSGWKNPEYLQILADAYQANNDELSAGLMDSRAKGLKAIKEISLEDLFAVKSHIQRLASI